MPQRSPASTIQPEKLYLKYFLLNFLKDLITQKNNKDEIKQIQDRLFKIVQEHGKNGELVHNGELLKINGKSSQPEDGSTELMELDLDNRQDETCKKRKRKQYLVIYKMEYLNINCTGLFKLLSHENVDSVLSAISFDYLHVSGKVKYHDVVQQEDLAKNLVEMDAQCYKHPMRTFTGGGDDPTLADLLDKGYLKKKIAPDGHCLFSCIATLVSSRMLAVREKVASWIRDSANTQIGSWWFMNHLVELQTDGVLKNPPRSEDALIEMIETGNTREVDADGNPIVLWGGNLELVALSNAYSLTIFVFHTNPKDGTQRKPDKFGDHNNFAYLLYNGTHYDLLEGPPKGSDQSSTQPSDGTSQEDSAPPSTIVTGATQFKSCRIISFQHNIESKIGETIKELVDTLSKCDLHIEIDYLQTPFANIELSIKCLYKKFLSFVEQQVPKRWVDYQVQHAMNCEVGDTNFEGIIPERLVDGAPEKEAQRQTQRGSVMVLQTRLIGDIRTLLNDNAEPICVVYNPINTDHFYMLFCQTYEREITTDITLQPPKQIKYQCDKCDRPIIENEDEYVSCETCSSQDKIKIHTSCAPNGIEQFACKYCGWIGKKVESSFLISSNKDNNLPAGCKLCKDSGKPKNGKDVWMWCSGTVESFQANSKNISDSTHNVLYDDKVEVVEELIKKLSPNNNGLISHARFLDNSEPVQPGSQKGGHAKSKKAGRNLLPKTGMGTIPFLTISRFADAVHRNYKSPKLKKIGRGTPSKHTITRNKQARSPRMKM
tara:strand:+ start:875 stop:3190 length:2316 start_codon:yes stop_codon:yes gene_type:complete